MARPTKWSPEMNDIAEDYLETYQTTHGHKIPSIAGLSLVLKVRRSTLYEWIKDDDKGEFSDILQDVLATQEQVLLSNGLDHTFNASIVKLCLGKHGYHDKQEVLGAEGGDFSMQVVYE